jgi:hypothetical protein
MYVKEDLDKVMESVRKEMPSIFEKQGGEDGAENLESWKFLL